MLTQKEVLCGWRKCQSEAFGNPLTRDSHWRAKQKAIDLFGEILSKHGWTRKKGSYKAVYLHPASKFVVKLTTSTPDRGGLYNPRHPVFLGYTHVEAGGVLGLQAVASTKWAKKAARLLEVKLWVQRRTLRLPPQVMRELMGRRAETDLKGRLAWAYDLYANNCGWVRGRPVCFDPIHPEFKPLASPRQTRRT
jgi:hypothetical protein